MYHIDPGSPIPVYHQLAKQIELHILSGDLGDGDKLPSIRELASELRINPNTIAKTYGILERKGLVVSRKGRGVFVSIRGFDIDESRHELFTELTEEYLKKAGRLGLSDDDILDLLSSRLKGRK
mgnify:CR=1 FL=1